MTTDKTIDEIMDDIKNYQITHIADEDISGVRNTIDKILEHIVRPTLTKHLHPEPAKDKLEPTVEKERHTNQCYHMTNRGTCSFQKREEPKVEPSEQGGGMLQPGEYMRDNEGNITTYEDEQKERLKDSQPKEVEI